MRLVLAYGNPLRGDDAAGWRIAEALRRLPETEIVCVHQLAPELAEQVARADGVLFLDAACGERPGAVSVRRLRADPETSSLGHVFVPSTLLYLARTFYGRSPEAALVTVAGQEFGFSTSLSRAVAAALPEAEEQARSILRRMGASGDRAGGTVRP
jgi:hydrogenase maturation protease